MVNKSLRDSISNIINLYETSNCIDNTAREMRRTKQYMAAYLIFILGLLIYFFSIYTLSSKLYLISFMLAEIATIFIAGVILLAMYVTILSLVICINENKEV